MSEMTIRPLALVDLAQIAEMDHSYHTDYVWQMELSVQEKAVQTGFREVRLPRSMHVHYPYSPERLVDEWKKRSLTLIAEQEEQTVGYISLDIKPGSLVYQIVDLVVTRRLRRNGIATALIRKAHGWAVEQNGEQLILELQSKNYPAISLAAHLGFEFCGYNDRYFPNGDIALFFARSFI